MMLPGCLSAHSYHLHVARANMEHFGRSWSLLSFQQNPPALQGKEWTNISSPTLMCSIESGKGTERLAGACLIGHE